MKSPRQTPQPDSLAVAAEVFVRGFSYTRSFTHPFLAERVGPLWVMRDAPRRQSADYRREEWVAADTAPTAVDRLARKHTWGRFCICALLPVGEPDVPWRAAYKALGYRLTATEPVMVHTLKTIPRFTSPARIERVRTASLADAVARAAGARQMLPEHLAADMPLRHYAASLDGRVVGWVRSIATPAGTWCSNMAVLPEFRRRGIASALLAALLRDDRRHRSPRSVLTASHTGARLYLQLGYRPVGTLLLFAPRK
ncbi:MAG: GNAT family N-acetyltransferase [Opitutales bacterium]